jgi:hypothetical protein
MNSTKGMTFIDPARLVDQTANMFESDQQSGPDQFFESDQQTGPDQFFGSDQQTGPQNFLKEMVKRNIFFSTGVPLRTGNPLKEAKTGNHSSPWLRSLLEHRFISLASTQRQKPSPSKPQKSGFLFKNIRQFFVSRGWGPGNKRSLSPF